MLNNVKPLVINTINCSLARILSVQKVKVTVIFTIYICYISLLWWLVQCL